MTFRLFVENLYNSQAMKNWNEHWQPQTSLCSYNFQQVIPLEAVNLHSFDLLLKHFQIENTTYDHIHKTQKIPKQLVAKQPETEATLQYHLVLKQIYEIYSLDYEVFSYKKDFQKDLINLHGIFSELPQICF